MGSTACLGSENLYRDVAGIEWPLAVNLDGTLVRVDTLHESFFSVFKSSPVRAIKLLKTICYGKAGFKHELAQTYPVDPQLLPYNEPLLNFLRDQKQRGRQMGLFTAADQSVAQTVADHLDLFEAVRGSDGIVNLSGERKVEAIRETCGPTFAYAGNDDADKPVFAAAQSVLLIGNVQRLRQSLPAGKRVEATFPFDAWRPAAWAKLLRIEHWAKNVLVFVAPILGFEIVVPEVLLQAVLLFVLMGLSASATYIINDALDLEADRQHPKKRFRALASGEIPIRDGIFAAAGLIVLAFSVSLLLLPVKVLFGLSAYLAGTLAYSFALKRQPMIDVLVLAGLFILRIIMGGFLLTAPITPWLLTFSMLFFVGLAMVKRYAELARVMSLGGKVVISRGYTANDLPLLLAAGVGSGLSAIVIFMIYLINEHYPKAIYGHPNALWMLMPILLLWILRIWRFAVHGQMNEDPVIFALTDRVSLVLGAGVGVTLIVAWF